MNKSPLTPTLSPRGEGKGEGVVGGKCIFAAYFETLTLLSVF